MDDVTQQNAALVEQAAAAAESLEEQAQQMVQVVTRFKLEESGQPQKAVSEKKAQRAEGLKVKPNAKKTNQPAPKKQKKLEAPTASHAPKDNRAG